MITCIKNESDLIFKKTNSLFVRKELLINTKTEFKGKNNISASNIHLLENYDQYMFENNSEPKLEVKNQINFFSKQNSVTSTNSENSEVLDESLSKKDFSFLDYLTELNSDNTSTNLTQRQDSGININSENK